MPTPAAGLADVVARDPHPLVLVRFGEHLPQQLAVAGLDLGPLAQHQAGLGDASCESVAHPLQATQVERPRRRDGGLHVTGERHPTEGLAEESGELTLEPADLASQLSPREALVRPGAKVNEGVSFEQIQHRTRPESRSPGPRHNQEGVKPLVT